MLKTKLAKLIKNIKKIPQEFFAQTAEERYRVIWFINRQKPSVEQSYDFDEERFGITTKGEIIYGFHSGCSCPSPWSAGDFGDDGYVVREYKEFFLGKDNTKEFDPGWEIEAEERLDDILLFLEKDISVDRLLKIKNAEIRRAIMKRIGFDKVRDAAQVLHKDEFGELLLLGEDKYVKVDDASTDRQYLLYVDSSVKTAKGAVAWTFGLKEDEYNPEVQT